MLGRLILMLLQIGLAWFGAPLIAKQVPVPANLQVFLYAVLFAILVFIVGLVASHVIKDVSTPTSATLTWSLVAALIGATLAKFGPDFVKQIPWRQIPANYMALGGAVLGYFLKR
jgi:predicted membrane channel-forming protein YqfA (hemolysin III family)